MNCSDASFVPGVLECLEDTEKVAIHAENMDLQACLNTVTDKVTKLI